MKAYGAYNEWSGYGVVVFAESAGKARAVLIHTDCFEDFEFTEVRPYRVPELDKEYRGHSEMDWCNEADRIALVKRGWHCAADDIDYSECDVCPASEWCYIQKERYGCTD